ILYATDVDGIYDKDPRRYPDARKLDRVHINDLAKFLSQRFEAGGYELLDPVAMQVVKRSCIEVVVFNGFKPENVERIVSGEHIGTLIMPCV
ncbi:MAG: UMP kinase, partial [Ignisphaera sp.]|nr:UMP kinase [Ignisphaera sp.]